MRETGDQARASQLLREALVLADAMPATATSTALEVQVEAVDAMAEGDADFEAVEAVEAVAVDEHGASLTATPSGKRKHSVSAPASVSEQRHVAPAWAVLAAQAEGLVLERVDSKSGYKGVADESRPGGASLSKPFSAKFRAQRLGFFATVEEAALAYARAAKAAVPSDEVRRDLRRRELEEASAAALRAAQAEGLVFERVDSKSGYKGQKVEPRFWASRESPDNQKEVV